jgi:hypothetical protein
MLGAIELVANKKIMKNIAQRTQHKKLLKPMSIDIQ